MEVSALQEYVLSLLGGTAVQTAEHATDTHRFFGIADHQVAVAELMLHAIEGHKRCAFWHGLHHHLAAFDLVGIEAVHRMAETVADIVGDIYDIIDRTQTDDAQTLLQPFRTLLHGDTLDGDAGIARTSLAVFYDHRDVKVVILHGKGIYRRLMQLCRFLVLHQVGIQIASHTVVRAGIGTVGRDVHLYHIVALDVIVVFGQSAHHSGVWQHDDARVVGTDADLVFCADHAA